MMKHPLFFFCLTLLLLILAACNDASPNSSANDTSSSNNIQSTTLPATVVQGNVHEFSLPQSDSGLMRPAIDSQGRLWFGEMNRNYLAVFDPHTQTFRQMTPPRGQSGIMGIQVAADDTIWFAEQYADYIGHYFPTTGKYQISPLPALTVPDPSDTSKTLTLPSAPNDLALDKHGNVWFTELNADALGKLDIATGHVQQYPLSADKSVQKLNPYGVTVDPAGIVWFTEASGSHVGRLDPATGTIQLFTVPGTGIAPMEIASDTHGTLWITTFASGLILSLDPHTGMFTSYATSSSANDTGGIYGILVTVTGDVWATDSTENAIAHLDPASKHFTYYALPTKGSLPLGLVMGPNHTLGFTEAGIDKIGMLQP
jgi:virginiamycin B lyase